MDRMTNVLTRMLADPRTRIGLNSHTNDLTVNDQLEHVTTNTGNYYTFF